MKKVLYLFLAVGLVVCLSQCGQTKETEEADTTAVEAVDTTQAPVTADTAATTTPETTTQAAK